VTQLLVSVGVFCCTTLSAATEVLLAAPERDAGCITLYDGWLSPNTLWEPLPGLTVTDSSIGLSICPNGLQHFNPILESYVSRKKLCIMTVAVFNSHDDWWMRNLLESVYMFGCLRTINIELWFSKELCSLWLGTKKHNRKEPNHDCTKNTC